MSNKLRITTTIEKELFNKIKNIAEEEGRHINYYISKGLKKMIEEYEKEFENNGTRNK